MSKDEHKLFKPLTLTEPPSSMRMMRDLPSALRDRRDGLTYIYSSRRSTIMKFKSAAELQLSLETIISNIQNHNSRTTILLVSILIIEFIETEHSQDERWLGCIEPSDRTAFSIRKVGQVCWRRERRFSRWDFATVFEWDRARGREPEFRWQYLSSLPAAAFFARRQWQSFGVWRCNGIEAFLVEKSDAPQPPRLATGVFCQAGRWAQQDPEQRNNPCHICRKRDTKGRQVIRRHISETSFAGRHARSIDSPTTTKYNSPSAEA